MPRWNLWRGSVMPCPLLDVDGDVYYLVWFCSERNDKNARARMVVVVVVGVVVVLRQEYLTTKPHYSECKER